MQRWHPWHSAVRMCVCVATLCPDCKGHTATEVWPLLCGRIADGQALWHARALSPDLAICTRGHCQLRPLQYAPPSAAKKLQEE